MHGLLRVRGFTQDDAHIFCTPGQILSEIEACLDFAEAVLKTLAFMSTGLSCPCAIRTKLASSSERQRIGKCRVGIEERADETRCPVQSIPAKARSMGRRSISNSSMCWGGCGSSRRCSSTSICRRGLSSNIRARWREAPAGDGAFRALFGISRAGLRSADRALRRAFRCGLLRCKWVLVPISEKHISEYAKAVKAKLEAAGLRVELDERNEKMKREDREFTLQKVPFVLVMGDKEAASEAVSVRTRAR